MSKPTADKSILSPANWTDAGTTLVMSLFLVLSALLYVFASSKVEPALGLLAMTLLVFSGSVLLLISSIAARLVSELVVGSCSLLMLGFIATVSVVIGGPNEFILLLLVIPVCYAALNGNSLGTGFIILSAALLWLTLNFSAWWPSLLSLATLSVTALPLLVVGVLVHLLSSEVLHARATINSLEDVDSLTGLLNRDAFRRTLEAEHKESAARNTSYALLHIDVDNLQVINDQYGRDAGDKTLAGIADALTRSVRKEDRVGRLGGDEFTVFLAYASDKTSNEVTNRVRQNIYNMTLSLARRSQRVQVSVGIAIYPESGASVPEMLKFAEQAMQRDRAFRQQVKPNSDPREQAGLGNIKGQEQQ